MASGFKNFIDKLNQPIGGGGKTSDKKRKANLALKTLELTPADAIKNTKNIRYNYKARDKDGNIIKSSLDALSKVDVHSYLMNQGYDVLARDEDKVANKFGLVQLTTKEMSPKDLNFFLTQLSTYLKAGITLMDAIDILAKQAKKKSVKNLYNRLVFELTTGETLSEALSKQGKVFPKLLINMVKTSELTGNLTGVLDDMAAYYKRQDSNRKQIINAMTYPSVLMVFAVAVLTFVITYVVPSFTSMYETTGSSLPGITVAIMDISNFVTNNWYYIIGGIILVVLVFYLLYKSSKKFKYYTQAFVMHIPVVKDIVKYNQLVTFTSTFSTLIKHDVFITDSMDILSKITENEIYKSLINDAIVNLSKGNGVSVAFKGHWAFPETAYEMLLTGEKTGKLGEMMEHVAAYYQEEQTNIIARLKSLIEPIMIVLLAVIVGVILLAVVVPMFDIYKTII